MRLWSLHPQYLDRQGLLALWREGLLAQAVLRDKTKGYRNHPQLQRFKTHPDPLHAIAYYLSIVHHESLQRGYHFDPTKFEDKGETTPIPVTRGQYEFEVAHLLAKLEKRSADDHRRVSALPSLDLHPLFTLVPGDIEDWEKVK